MVADIWPTRPAGAIREICRYTRANVCTHGSNYRGSNYRCYSNAMRSNHSDSIARPRPLVSDSPDCRPARRTKDTVLVLQDRPLSIRSALARRQLATVALSALLSALESGCFHVGTQRSNAFSSGTLLRCDNGRNDPVTLLALSAQSRSIRTS
jgi:hypothetical protein